MKAIHIFLNFLLALVMGFFAHAGLATVDPVTASQVPAWTIGTTLYAGQIIYQSVYLGKLPHEWTYDLTINDTSYEGEYLRQFISLAMTGFDTLNKGCINVMGGIKKKKAVPTIKIKNFIQARVATPTSTHSGTAVVDKRVLEPQDVMGYLEFNPRDFESHWEATQMQPQLLDAMLPNTLESAITQEVLKGNRSYVDRAIWQSDKDDAAIATAKANGLGDGDNNLIFFDGFQKKMFLDSNVIKVPTPVALTQANFFDKMELVAQDIPSAVYDQPNFKFIISNTDKKKYGDAQKAQTNKGVDKTQAAVLEFDGKSVVPVSGMSANTIAGVRGSTDLLSNLWLGVNEIDEDQYLKIAMLAANSEEAFIKMLAKMDVNYGFGEEIVLYTTETYS